MKGVHEDEVGSQYLRPNYKRGAIVRKGDQWGVVLCPARNRWHPDPVIEWWCYGQWMLPSRCVADDRLSAPFAHTYEGIPDEVLAKATHYMLVPEYRNED